MRSKEQTQDHKTGAKQSSKRDTVNIDALEEQHIRPAAIVQRAKFDPGSLSPNDVLQLQRMVGNQTVNQLLTGMGQNPTIPKKENHTGLPDNIKSGVENLSGYSIDNVKVHYNSDKPAQLDAHAYTQGADIHVAPGQEEHLSHEAWHVVQQKQGRVSPAMQMKGNININDDAGLEKEADVMGAKASNEGLKIMDNPLEMVHARGMDVKTHVGKKQGNKSQTTARAFPGKANAEKSKSSIGANIIQRYHTSPASGQKGEFIPSAEAAIHCHIGIGTESHLKISGHRYNFGDSQERMQNAYNELVGNARNSGLPGYADCVEYLEEQGCAAMPTGAATVTPPPRLSAYDNPATSRESKALIEEGLRVGSYPPRTHSRARAETVTSTRSTSSLASHVPITPPPVATSLSPAVSTHPPLATSLSPAITTHPPLATSHSPAITTPPPLATSHSPAVTTPPPLATSHSPAVTTPPPLATSHSSAVTTPPPLATSHSSAVITPPPVAAATGSPVSTAPASNARRGWCYITTACVQHKGFDDNCEELTILRSFRDTYLLKKNNGPELLQLYYKYSPMILQSIKKRDDEEEILARLYEIIKQCVDAIKRGDNEFAYTTYCKMVVELKKEFVPEIEVSDFATFTNNTGQ